MGGTKGAPSGGTLGGGVSGGGVPSGGILGGGVGVEELLTKLSQAWRGFSVLW